MVAKQWKAVVINIAILSGSNIRKKKHKTYRGLKDKLQKMWEVRATMSS